VNVRWPFKAACTPHHTLRLPPTTYRTGPTYRRTAGHLPSSGGGTQHLLPFANYTTDIPRNVPLDRTHPTYRPAARRTDGRGWFLGTSSSAPRMRTPGWWLRSGPCHHHLVMTMTCSTFGLGCTSHIPYHTLDHTTVGSFGRWRGLLFLTQPPSSPQLVSKFFSTMQPRCSLVLRNCCILTRLPHAHLNDDLHVRTHVYTPARVDGAPGLDGRTVSFATTRRAGRSHIPAI